MALMSYKFISKKNFTISINKMQTLQNPPSPSNSPLPPYLLSKLRYSKIRVHLRSSSPQKRAGGHFPSLSRLFLHNPRPLLTLALLCCALLYLPHCGNLPHPAGAQVVDGTAPNQPPARPPPVALAPIYLWVTNCRAAGDMDRAIYQAWETNLFVSNLFIPAPECAGVANADGRDAAHDICAVAYADTVDAGMTLRRASVNATDQANIAANIPAGSLRHRAIININTGLPGVNADDIISSAADRQWRPIHRPDGTFLTRNWNDLFDASIDLRDPITTTTLEYWTGIGIGGGSFTDAALHCASWTNGTTVGAQGASGDGSSINDGRLSGFSASCTNALSTYLLCASFEDP